MNTLTEKWTVNTFWSGYCPECQLKGIQSRMRLNSNDFFECEKSQLQIAISFPDVEATILKWRGKADYKSTLTYADELSPSETLCRQTLKSWPYTEDALFESSDEIEKYILEDVELRYLGEMKKYADLAFKVLEKSSSYMSNKKMISEIFKTTQNEKYLDVVIFRLTLIDSFYSTQMNKRLFGIEDIANKIVKEAPSDEILKEHCIKFLTVSVEGSVIMTLLQDDEYGINKEGVPYGKAISLISKYLYFLMGYQFPIYDKLARVSYEKLRTFPEYKQLEIPKIKPNNNASYFENFKKLNEVSQIRDFNKLDNLLWLMGKINEGSLNLILDKDGYKALVGIHEIKSKIDSIIKNKKNNITKMEQLTGENNDNEIANPEYKKIDKIISNYLNENDKLSALSGNPDLIAFIKYAKQFKPENSKAPKNIVL